MAKRLLLFIFTLTIAPAVSGQTQKTGAVVVGNTVSGIAAAIQSARSGAETIFLTQNDADPDFTADDLTYLEKIKNHYIRKSRKRNAQADTAFNFDMQKPAYTAMIKGISDTTKNLKVIAGVRVSKIEKAGKGWELRLSNGKKIRATVIVDATEQRSVASKLNIDASKTMTAVPNTGFESKLYRSTVARAYTGAGDERSVTLLSLGSFIPVGVENFILVPETSHTVSQVPMSAGQAAGTLAAYVAFFNTTTKSINVRIVQGELLAFDAELIPFQDINPNDPNFMAFQRMGVSGLLKPSTVKEGGHNVFRFDTTGTVSTDEIRAPMREFYSASQIWFLDNKSDELTVEQLISLLKVVARRGNELNAEIEEGWNKSFKLDGKFDPKKPVTRKEFAILADKYLAPFNVRVDFAGNLLS